MVRVARTYRRDHEGYGSQQPRPPVTSRARPRQLVVEGLPRLEPRALLGVAPSGDRLMIAYGRRVETYTITLEEERAVAHRVGRATLPAAARDLLVASDGTTFAIARRGTLKTAIVRIDGNRSITLRTLDVHPTAAAATRHHVVLAMPADDLVPPQLLALRRTDGAVVWREPLGSADVRLRAGRGDELLVIEPTRRRALDRRDASSRTLSHAGRRPVSPAHARAGGGAGQALLLPSRPETGDREWLERAPVHAARSRRPLRAGHGRRARRMQRDLRAGRLGGQRQSLRAR